MVDTPSYKFGIQTSSDPVITLNFNKFGSQLRRGNEPPLKDRQKSMIVNGQSQPYQNSIAEQQRTLDHANTLIPLTSQQKHNESTSKDDAYFSMTPMILKGGT